MNDEQLDEALKDAAAHWRVAVDPPLDTIWDGVEARAFPIRRRGAGWSVVGIAAAAALVIGVLGGRYSMRRAAMPQINRVAAVAAVSPAATDPDRPGDGGIARADRGAARGAAERGFLAVPWILGSPTRAPGC